MLKIFVCHWSKLQERKQFILDQFEKYNITNYEFVEMYDKDELTEEECSYFDLEKCKISLSLKHFYIYREIAAKYDEALIFEDDVILNAKFMENLGKYMKQLPADYDMLYLGDGCKLHINRKNIIHGINVYISQTSRCTDSYIVSKKCALQLCEYKDNLKNKITLPIDWWLNSAISDNNLKNYWAEPTICSQGTHTGLFKTSLV